MSKKLKAILGIITGLGIAGVGAYALTNKNVCADEAYDVDETEDYEEEAESEDVENSEE